MKKIIFFILFVFLAQSVFADGLLEFMECKKTQKDQDRLKCYDIMAEKLTTSFNSPENINNVPPIKNENWEIGRDISQMDGKKSVSYAIESITTLKNSLDMDKKAKLVFRCDNNKTDAFILWPSFVGYLDEKKVEIKVDDGKVIKSFWYPAGNGDGVFSKEPIKWMKSLLGKKRMIVRLAAHNRIPEEVTFYIDGVDAAITEISNSCGWKK